jgi:hypothetical protein
MDQKATRTTFPLRLERERSFPSRVGRVKSGAGALILTCSAARAEKGARIKQSEQTKAKSKEKREDGLFSLQMICIAFMISLLVSGFGVVQCILTAEGQP